VDAVSRGEVVFFGALLIVAVANAIYATSLLL
jgi:hypothetical protein